jgi:hypothetical protein
MAMMNNCTLAADDVSAKSAQWTWDPNGLNNPKLGSSICLRSSPTECLAAQAVHEHARVIVTRNADMWYFNQTDHTIRDVKSANELAFAINCNYPDGCNHDGANLLVSSPYVVNSRQKLTNVNAQFIAAGDAGAADIIMSIGTAYTMHALYSLCRYHVHRFQRPDVPSSWMLHSRQGDGQCWGQLRHI